MGITRFRVELKYRVPPDLLPPVLRRLPDGERRRYSIASTYLDRSDGLFARSAGASPQQCLKVRLREYGEEPGRRIWLELKQRLWAWTRKWRFPLPRAAVPALLRGELPGRMEPEADATPRETAELARALESLRGCPLRPVGCVRVRRTTFSYPDDQIRFSIDEDIVYSRTPRGCPPAIWPAPDSEILAREPSAVLELKDGGAGSAWCPSVVEGLEFTQYSKFRTLLDLTSRPAELPHVG